MRLRALNIPAVLTASVLSSGCPAEDDDDDTTGSPSTTNTTTDASSSGVSATAGDSSGSGGSSTETGAPADCEALDNAACPDATGCALHPDLGSCVDDCAINDDQASCMENLWCQWTGTLCDWAPVE